MNKHDREIMRDIKRRWAIKCETGELFCFLCGKQIKNMKDCTADHWVPLSLGGKTSESNLKPACKLCNNRKGSIPPAEFEANKEAILSGNYDKKHKRSHTENQHKEKHFIKKDIPVKSLYELGTEVYFVDKKNNFQIRTGVILGSVVRDNILYVLVRSYYQENNEIKSEMLETVPLTKQQAKAIQSDYRKILLFQKQAILKELQR